MKKSVVCAGLGVLALVVSGCGSASGGSTANSSAQSAQSAQEGAPAGGFGQRDGFRMPGASGLIAAISGKTAQVQGTDAQTAVTWNAKTVFSAEKAVSSGAVKVGTCVVAMPTRPTGIGSAPGTSTAADTTSTTVAAATVRITGTGNCNLGFRSRTPGAASGGTPPSGMPQVAPSGAPSGAPGGFGGRAFGGFGAVGKVGKVTSNGFVVSSDLGGTSRTVTVTTSASTKYTENVPATAAAVKVGQCMSAQGSTDSTGAVTAARVTLSAPVGGSCTSGFAVFGGPRSDQSGGQAQ